MPSRIKSGAAKDSGGTGWSQRDSNWESRDSGHNSRGNDHNSSRGGSRGYSKFHSSEVRFKAGQERRFQSRDVRDDRSGGGRRVMRDDWKGGGENSEHRKRSRDSWDSRDSRRDSRDHHHPRNNHYSHHRREDLSSRSSRNSNGAGSGARGENRRGEREDRRRGSGSPVHKVRKMVAGKNTGGGGGWSSSTRGASEWTSSRVDVTEEGNTRISEIHPQLLPRNGSLAARPNSVLQSPGAVSGGLHFIPSPHLAHPPFRTPTHRVPLLHPLSPAGHLLPIPAPPPPHVTGGGTVAPQSPLLRHPLQHQYPPSPHPDHRTPTTPTAAASLIPHSPLPAQQKQQQQPPYKQSISYYHSTNPRGVATAAAATLTAPLSPAVSLHHLSAASPLSPLPIPPAAAAAAAAGAAPGFLPRHPYLSPAVPRTPTSGGARIPPFSPFSPHPHAAAAAAAAAAAGAQARSNILMAQSRAAAAAAAAAFEPLDVPVPEAFRSDDWRTALTLEKKADEAAMERVTKIEPAVRAASTALLLASIEESLSRTILEALNSEIQQIESRQEEVL